jgi:hypothetical protein
MALLEMFQVQVVSRFSKFHAMMAGSWLASICRGCLSVSMKLINFQSFYFVWSYLLTSVFSHCLHNSALSCICLHMFCVAVLMIGRMLAFILYHGSILIVLQLFWSVCQIAELWLSNIIATNLGTYQVLFQTSQVTQCEHSSKCGTK